MEKLQNANRSSFIELDEQVRLNIGVITTDATYKHITFFIAIYNTCFLIGDFIRD
jgi:hypothetical protein